jgi:predicted RNase H-like nuclease (RuvC/YqgF family)
MQRAISEPLGHLPGTTLIAELPEPVTINEMMDSETQTDAPPPAVVQSMNSPVQHFERLLSSTDDPLVRDFLAIVEALHTMEGHDLGHILRPWIEQHASRPKTSEFVSVQMENDGMDEVERIQEQDRIQQLERDVYYFRLTNRELKQKLRQVSSAYKQSRDQIQQLESENGRLSSMLPEIDGEGMED